MTKFVRTYASALFDLASEEGLDEVILQDVILVAEMINQTSGYIKLLQSPVLGREERNSLIDEVWKDKIHIYSLNFLKIVCDKEKAGEFVDCASEYEALYNKQHNIAVAKLTCAVPFSDELLEKLVSVLETKTGKKIKLDVEIDESVIGGLRLDMDGVRYDGTISNHLDAIKMLLS